MEYTKNREGMGVRRTKKELITTSLPNSEEVNVYEGFCVLVLEQLQCNHQEKYFRICDDSLDVFPRMNAQPNSSANLTINLYVTLRIRII